MVKGAIEALKLAGVADKVIRFGLRYISFIDGDVFDKIDVELRVNSKSVSARETSEQPERRSRCDGGVFAGSPHGRKNNIFWNVKV
jgi:hypothetical protein